MDELNIEQKKLWVIGLLFDCPMGKPLENCPANEFRALPVKERLELVRSMDDSQLEQIIDHHRKCLNERENPQHYQNR